MLSLPGCIVLLIFGFNRGAIGCHSGVDDYDYSHDRVRRQTDTETEELFSVEVEDTRNLRNYFTDCIRDKAGNDFQGAVDYTILDTLWFQRTDVEACNQDDTAQCWRERLNVYIRQTSSLLGPSNECIEQYSIDIRNGITDYTSRQKRQVLDDGGENVLLTSYVTCLNRTLVLPRNRRDLDLLEVVEFVEDHAICGECDEGRGNRLGITEEELENSFVDPLNIEQEAVDILEENPIIVPPQPSVGSGCRPVIYPFLLERLTRRDSPLFQTITTCNAEYSGLFLANPCEDVQNVLSDGFCFRQQSWCKTFSQFEPQYCQKMCCEINAGAFNDAPPPGWSAWSPWGACPAQCFETALQQRERSCPLGVPGTYPCIGNTTETRVCNSILVCPIWSEWSPWSECGRTCGRSIRSSIRNCLNGNSCPGLPRRIRLCNGGPCFGVFSNWNQWNTCSLTCGGGEQLRFRQCVRGPICQPDQYGDVTNQQQNCNEFQCLGSWSAWGQWSTCGVTCGGIGTQQVRQRNCVGDGPCPGQGMESRFCGNDPCPIPQWAVWSTWSDCTWQRRTRICVGGEIGSGLCQGDEYEYFRCSGSICNRQENPIPTRWSNWGSCSQNCGSSFQTRNRICSTIFGGNFVCPNARPDVRCC